MAEGPVAVLSEHPEGDFGSTGTWRGSRAFSSTIDPRGSTLNAKVSLTSSCEQEDCGYQRKARVRLLENANHGNLPG